MKDIAVSALLVRIEQTWPVPRWSQAKLDMWREDLALLDEGAAGTAFVQLRRTHKDCITIAELTSAAKALHTVDAGNREHCGFCDGTGWIPGPNDGEYTTVQPCECPNGDGPRVTQSRYTQSRAWTRM